MLKIRNKDMLATPERLTAKSIMSDSLFFLSPLIRNVRSVLRPNDDHELKI